MTSFLSWQLGQDAETAIAEWTLDEPLTQELIGVFFASAVTAATRAAPAWQALPLDRHTACITATQTRHSLRWSIPSSKAFFACVPLAEDDDSPPDRDVPLCVRVTMRKGGSGYVRWESPLVTLQRCEGIVVAQDPGVDTESGGVLAWRLPPVSAQAIIVAAVRWATERGSATGSAAVHEAAARDLNAYASATAALLEQVARVSSGGEAWTTEERLAKLSKLQQLAGPALHKLEHGTELSDMERATVDALAEGRAEFAARLAEPDDELEGELQAAPVDEEAN